MHGDFGGGIGSASALGAGGLWKLGHGKLHVGLSRGDPKISDQNVGERYRIGALYGERYRIGALYGEREGSTGCARRQVDVPSA